MGNDSQGSGDKKSDGLPPADTPRTNEWFWNNNKIGIAYGEVTEFCRQLERERNGWERRFIQLSLAKFSARVAPFYFANAAPQGVTAGHDQRVRVRGEPVGDEARIGPSGAGSDAVQVPVGAAPIAAIGEPTYYVRHPDDTYSVADPQPSCSAQSATKERV